MSQRFAGKIAIVTGAGNGIGIPIATRLAEEGASVVLADKEEAAAQAVCRRITAAGGKAAACRVDICVPKDVEAMVAYSRDLFGPAHIMINITGQTIAVDGGFSAAGLRVKNLAARDGSY